MPVILVLQRSGHESQSSLDYTARPCLKQTNVANVNISVLGIKKILRQMFTYVVALSVRPDPVRKLLAWPHSFVRK